MMEMPTHIERASVMEKHWWQVVVYQIYPRSLKIQAGMELAI